MKRPCTPEYWPIVLFTSIASDASASTSKRFVVVSPTKFRNFLGSSYSKVATSRPAGVRVRTYELVNMFTRPTGSHSRRNDLDSFYSISIPLLRF